MCCLYLQVRTDLMDTHIAVCAPEVIMLFSDNFDYQNVKRDFVSGE
jgi:translation initiation factor eIF-2B subunit epsilon